MQKIGMAAIGPLLEMQEGLMRKIKDDPLTCADTAFVRYSNLVPYSHDTKLGWVKPG